MSIRPIYLRNRSPFVFRVMNKVTSLTSTTSCIRMILVAMSCLVVFVNHFHASFIYSSHLLLAAMTTHAARLWYDFIRIDSQHFGVRVKNVSDNLDVSFDLLSLIVV